MTMVMTIAAAIRMTTTPRIKPRVHPVDISHLPLWLGPLRSAREDTLGQDADDVALVLLRAPLVGHGLALLGGDLRRRLEGFRGRLGPDELMLDGQATANRGQREAGVPDDTVADIEGGADGGD